MLGQIAGAVVGGTLGGVIAQGSQIGLGTYFLKFGRAAESQADILGAQMLARAGYDPRQMANMFKTIEARGRQPRARVHEQPSQPGQPLQRHQQGGEHPAACRATPTRAQFGSVKSAVGRHVAGADRRADRREQEEAVRRARPRRRAGRAVRVEPPAAAGAHVSARRASCASPCRPTGSSDRATCVTYAPEGGFYSRRQRTHRLHARRCRWAWRRAAPATCSATPTRSLQGFARSNPNLRSAGSRRENLGGRTGLTTILSNVSDATGQPEVDRRLHDAPEGRQRAVPRRRVAARPRAPITRRVQARAADAADSRTEREVR